MQLNHWNLCVFLGRFEVCLTSLSAYYFVLGCNGLLFVNVNMKSLRFEAQTLTRHDR